MMNQTYTVDQIADAFDIDLLDVIDLLSEAKTRRSLQKESSPQLPLDLVYPANTDPVGEYRIFDVTKRMTAKGFCTHKGYHISRQTLGIYASRVAHANNVKEERRAVGGLSHPVSTWPLSVWTMAYERMLEEEEG